MIFNTQEQSFVDDVMFGRVSEDDLKLDNPQEGHDYGENWDEMRQKARQRDDNECQVCGKSEAEVGRELDVHHITAFKTFDSWEVANELSNLVCLCRKHHAQYERKENELRTMMEADE